MIVVQLGVAWGHTLVFKRVTHTLWVTSCVLLWAVCMRGSVSKPLIGKQVREKGCVHINVVSVRLRDENVIAGGSLSEIVYTMCSQFAVRLGAEGSLLLTVSNEKLLRGLQSSR